MLYELFILSGFVLLSCWAVILIKFVRKAEEKEKENEKVD